MRIKRVEEQRKQHDHKLMASVGLECHLMNLHREIIAGDSTKLPEFQQMVQYAPQEMKSRLLERLQC
jgi:hypothetical protein